MKRDDKSKGRRVGEQGKEKEGLSPIAYPFHRENIYNIRI